MTSGGTRGRFIEGFGATLRAGFAMWWGIFAPAAAGRRLVCCSGPAFVVAAGVQFLLAEVAAIALLLFNERQGHSLSFLGWRPRSDSRSLHEIWSQAHAGGGWSIFEYTFVLTPTVLAACWLLLAVVAFPLAHRRGSLSDSLVRSLRLSMLAVGYVLASAVAVLGFASFAHQQLVWLPDDSGFRWWLHRPEFWGLFALLCQGLLVVLLWRVDQGARAVAELLGAPVVPPRCEGCGYDLTHRADDGRCTECGFSVNRSLTFGRVRRSPRAGWLTNIPAHLRAVWRLLVMPRRFYQHHPVRGSAGAARAFATLHVAAMVITAAPWLFLTFVLYELTRWGGNEPWMPVLSISVNVGTAAVLAGHLLKRLVAALVAMVFVLQQDLADLAWLAKPIAYETAWLWLFLVPSASLLSFSVWFNLPLRNVPAVAWVMRPCGVPPEFVLLFGWNLLLLLGWFNRWRIIRDAIRYNNF